MSIIGANEIARFFKSLLTKMDEQTKLLTEIREFMVIRRESEEEKRLAKFPVFCLKFPKGSQAQAVLLNRGINTVGELVQHTESEMREERLVPCKSLTDIKEALAKEGLCLKQEIPNP